MKKSVVSLFIASLFTTAVYSQVQLDKKIELTGSGGDAKIEGIDAVVNNKDAANKIYVDTAIANRAGGSTSNMTFALSASATLVSCPATGNTNANPVSITATMTGGNAALLSYSISGLPTNTTANLIPGGGMPKLVSQLTFVTSGAAAGTYTVTITGTSGTNTASASIILRIGNRRLFVTSNTTTVGGGVTAADNFCQGRADAVSLGGQYKAFLGMMDRMPRAVIQDGPYMLINGTNVANNRADFFDGTIATAITRTELNGTYNGQVATGSRWYGSTSLCSGGEPCNCGEWTYPSGSILIMGNSGSTGSDWADCNCGPNCSGSFHLYCFEQ